MHLKNKLKLQNIKQTAWYFAWIFFIHCRKQPQSLAFKILFFVGEKINFLKISRKCQKWWWRIKHQKYMFRIFVPPQHFFSWFITHPLTNWWNFRLLQPTGNFLEMFVQSWLAISHCSLWENTNIFKIHFKQLVKLNHVNNDLLCLWQLIDRQFIIFWWPRRHKTHILVWPRTCPYPPCTLNIQPCEKTEIRGNLWC